MNIEQSKAFRYVLSKGWSYRTTDTEIILEECPICSKNNWHFYINTTPEKDGLFSCKVCGESGNLYGLRSYLGDKDDNVVSMKDAAHTASRAQPLPDVDKLHADLLADNVAMAYLLDERGFSLDVITKFKLGVVTEFGKRWLAIPYFQHNTLVYVKYRTLPPADKEFRGLAGREAPLFNQDCLVAGLESVCFVEGEADCLVALSNGVESVVGVPGASLKKTSWIKMLDDLDPKKVFIVYDKDRAGQTGAKELAQRIGLDKCYNVLLPDFVLPSGKPGKDLAEWFHSGGTLEQFEELKAQARPFSVDGVYHVSEVVADILSDIDKNGSLNPKYDSPWPSVNAMIGGMEDGDVVGIMAEGKVGKTTLAINWLQYLANKYDEASFLYCQEMMPKRLVRKWVSMVTETDDGEITKETVSTAMGVAANMRGDYLFGHTPGAKMKEVSETIRQAHRRYGVKFVCFDNLQFLCRNLDHSAQETSAISKGFKDLAMELRIVILLIIQPNRVREGEIVSARNSMGSSAIEKDVDAMLCLHRGRQGKIKEADFEAMPNMDVAENFTPQLLVRADLTRYAAGGVKTLWLWGAQSRVTEFPSEELIRSTTNVVSIDRNLQGLVAA